MWAFTNNKISIKNLAEHVYMSLCTYGIDGCIDTDGFWYCFRRMEWELETSGIRLESIKQSSHPDVNPCTKDCMRQFMSQRMCQHNMRYCTVCCEQYISSQISDPSCPMHGLNQHGVVSVLTTLNPHNRFDTDCDSECTYLYKKRLSEFCRHSMCRCYHCGACWDGLAQCPCYLERSPTPQPDGNSIDGFEMSSDSDSCSDEDVFSPKTRESTEPDSTTS